MNFSFDLVICILYSVIIISILVKYLKSKSKPKKLSIYSNSKHNRENIADPTRATPMYLIRNQYFPDNIEYTAFFINDHMLESFNIFIKLSPSIISTLTKAERRMIAFRSSLDNPMMDEEMLLHEMYNLRDIINELIKVSHVMLEKLDDVSSLSIDNIATSQVNPDAVKAYMSSVNVLMELTDNHSILNFETHNRLAKEYPNLVEPFLVMSGKLSYLFFVILISYSNHIDENLFVYI